MGWRDAWRSLRQRKSSVAGPLLALQRVGQPLWTPRRYEKLAEEGYQKNVVAYRAVSEVTRSAASVPWVVHQRTARGREALAEHPLLDLLRRPNPLMAQAEFVEAVIGYYLISGNSYIEAVTRDLMREAPRELWPLRPDRMRVLPGRLGLPEGYEYRVGGETRSWPSDPVSGASPILHLRAFHPLNDWYGLSAIEAAATAIDQRNEADAWNMALLQNSARPSGAFVYAPKDGAENLSDAQLAQLKHDLDDQYQGAKRAGRPLILEGGLDWREMGLSPKDMDFLDAKHATARDIAQAFGVPSQLLGIPGDNTYANYREARLALWEETVIPLLRHLRDEFNGWLAPMFDERLTVDLDLDQVPALTVRRERLWESVRAAHFLSINEQRQLLGFGPRADGDRLVAIGRATDLNSLAPVPEARPGTDPPKSHQEAPARRSLDVPFELKRIDRVEDAEGCVFAVFEGLASTFGKPDLVGDVIERDAFKGAKASRVKMLWQHDVTQPIGVWDELVETDQGLRVKGRLILDVRRAREAYALMRAHAIDALSIGFSVPPNGAEYDDGVRRLRRVELWEVSLVTFPANPRARVHRLKTKDAKPRTKRELEKRLRDAGASRSDAKAMISLGLNGNREPVANQRDAEGEAR